jgi:uncharacterized protein YjlB
MVTVKSYQLPPTKLIPNSKFPLLHYKNLLKPNELVVERIHDRFAREGWETQWIFRYGPTQSAHYHSQTHECMVVLTGEATIRFGTADIGDDMEANTHGSAKERGGVIVKAKAGDAFLIPAGVSHKTFDTTKGSTFKLLTPGEGHGIPGDTRKVLKEIELSGFTMLGAYPNGGVWDFAVGGEDEGRYKQVWDVPKPESDPFLGQSKEGLCGRWESGKKSSSVKARL